MRFLNAARMPLLMVESAGEPPATAGRQCDFQNLRLTQPPLHQSLRLSVNFGSVLQCHRATVRVSSPHVFHLATQRMAGLVSDSPREVYARHDGRPVLRVRQILAFPSRCLYCRSSSYAHSLPDRIYFIGSRCRQPFRGKSAYCSRHALEPVGLTEFHLNDHEGCNKSTCFV